MTLYEIETKCEHQNAYMNEATGVMRCPECQCTRHRIGEINGSWEWRRYGTYTITSKEDNDQRLASIEACFD